MSRKGPIERTPPHPERVGPQRRQLAPGGIDVSDLAAHGGESRAPDHTVSGALESSLVAMQRLAGNRALQEVLGGAANATPYAVQLFSTAYVPHRSGRLEIQRRQLWEGRPPRQPKVWNSETRKWARYLLRVEPLEKALDLVEVRSDEKFLLKLDGALEAIVADISLEKAGAADFLLEFPSIWVRYARIRLAIAERLTVLGIAAKVVDLAQARVDGKPWTAKDEETVLHALSGLPAKSLLQVEREVVLWPTGAMVERIGTAAARQRASDLIAGPFQAGALDWSPVEKDAHLETEAQRGRFEPSVGERHKQESLDTLERMNFDKDRCVAFLRLAAKGFHEKGDTEAWRAVESRNKEGQREGGEKVTITRLALELRVQGKVGPTHFLSWKDGQHEPRPETLLEKLSDAGDGWYFFYIGVFRHHSRLLAIEVDGGSRTYLLTEHLASLEKKEKLQDITGRVNDEFDQPFADPDPHRSLGSRVWQVYAPPQDDEKSAGGSGG